MSKDLEYDRGGGQPLLKDEDYDKLYRNFIYRMTMKNGTAGPLTVAQMSFLKRIFDDCRTKKGFGDSQYAGPAHHRPHPQRLNTEDAVKTLQKEYRRYLRNLIMVRRNLRKVISEIIY